MTSEVVWGEGGYGEEEVVAIKGELEDIAGYENNPGAIVTGLHGYRFLDPIFGHADTFMELEEAGVLKLEPEVQVPFVALDALSDVDGADDGELMKPLVERSIWVYKVAV